MSRPAIYFDWDGTIADSMPVCIGEIRLALERMGLPDLPDSLIRKCNGPTYKQSVPILGIPQERGEEFLRMRKAAELEIVPYTQRLFPGIREMLAHLKGRADLVIVSNGLEEYLELSSKVTGVADLFDGKSAFKSGRTKAEALAEQLEAMKPARAVMVGDRLGDIEAGKANGLPTIVVRFGYGNQAEWDCADQQAETVEELTRMLDAFLDEE